MDFYAIFLAPERMKRRTQALAAAIAESLGRDQSDWFKKSISVTLIDNKSAEISIGKPGVFAERGRQARDMRATMLASPNAKISKNGGRYLNIPMGGDKFRTMSSNGQPWMVKAKAGLNRVQKTLAGMSTLLVATRGAMFDEGSI